jgi:hypothetical protein
MLTLCIEDCNTQLAGLIVLHVWQDKRNTNSSCVGSLTNTACSNLTACLTAGRQDSRLLTLYMISFTSSFICGLRTICKQQHLIV